MRRMKQHEFNLLLSSLDTAVEILARHRTPDHASVAAFDALKQARARVLNAIESGQPVHFAPVEQLVAA